jgi:hypothetical protein
MMTDEEQERAILFSQLDVIHARKIDRRRSLKQLREMMDQHKRDAAKASGSTAAATASGGKPDPAVP